MFTQRRRCADDIYVIHRIIINVTGRRSLIFKSEYTYPLSFLEHLYQQQTYHNRNNGGHHPRHHERMIQNPFSNACCSCTVKIYSCHYCRIIRNKEISVGIEQQRWRMICLNDSEHISDFDRQCQRLCKAFERILPEKSSYEI